MDDAALALRTRRGVPVQPMSRYGKPPREAFVGQLREAREEWCGRQYRPNAANLRPTRLT